MPVPDARDRLQGLDKPAGVLLVVLVLATCVWPLYGVIRDMQNPWVISDDMRPVVGMYAPELPPPPPGPAAELAEYQRDRFWGAPPVYAPLIDAVTLMGDPWKAAEWGTLPAFALAVLAIAAIGYHIAGIPGALAAAALVCHADYFIGRAVGTLPHAFGVPLLAGMLFALATGRDVLLLWLMPVSALLYPPATVVGAGACAARALWAWHAGELGPRWRRLALHAAIAAAITGGAAWWFASADESSRPYTYAQALGQPMFSAGGRGPFFVPFEPAYRTFARAAARGIQRQSTWEGMPPAWHLVALAVAGLGLGVCWRRIDPRLLRGALCLALGSVAAYVAARLVAFRLYAPDRYVAYSFPVLVVVLWLAVAVAVLRRWRPGPSGATWGALAAVGTALLVGGPGRPGANAFLVRVTPAEQLVIAGVRALPPDAVVSGPADLMDTVFALAHRYTYLSSEVFVPLHPAEWAWMAPRYDAHIAAYYAADWGPVVALYRQGVTHMVVRRGDLDPMRPTPDQIWYEPFAGTIQALRQRHAPRGYVLAEPPPAAIVLRTPAHLLIDLAKLPAVARARGDAAAHAEGPTFAPTGEHAPGT